LFTSGGSADLSVHGQKYGFSGSSGSCGSNKYINSIIDMAPAKSWSNASTRKTNMSGDVSGSSVNASMARLWMSLMCCFLSCFVMGQNRVKTFDCCFCGSNLSKSWMTWSRFQYCCCPDMIRFFNCSMVMILFDLHISN
jgi:hypothetical protein